MQGWHDLGSKAEQLGIGWGLHGTCTQQSSLSAVGAQVSVAWLPLDS